MKMREEGERGERRGARREEGERSGKKCREEKKRGEERLEETGQFIPSSWGWRLSATRQK